MIKTIRCLRLSERQPYAIHEQSIPVIYLVMKVHARYPAVGRSNREGPVVTGFKDGGLVNSA